MLAQSFLNNSFNYMCHEIKMVANNLYLMILGYSDKNGGDVRLSFTKRDVMAP